MPPGTLRSRSFTRLTMRVGFEHLGQSVLLEVSMSFLRSAVLAILAIVQYSPDQGCAAGGHAVGIPGRKNLSFTCRTATIDFTPRMPLLSFAAESGNRDIGHRDIGHRGHREIRTSGHRSQGMLFRQERGTVRVRPIFRFPDAPISISVRQ